MQSWRLKEGFGLDHLVLEEGGVPAVAEGGVLLRMKAASPNYIDLLIIQGALGGDFTQPFIPVADGAGVVEAVGAGVEGFAPGDHVATTYIPDWRDGRYTSRHASLERRPGMGTLDGQLTQYKLVPEQAIIKVPGSLSFEEAATLPIAGLTAWNALAYAGIKAGDSVLIHGTGGVAVFALQFAKAAGARVIITSSSDIKLAKARGLGADHAINYRTNPDWVPKVLQCTQGEGVDLVVETVGGTNLNKSIEALRLQGHIAVVGFLEGVQSEINLIGLNLKQATVRGMSVGSTRDFGDMLRAMEVNAIQPVIDVHFPFEEAAAALLYLKEGRHFGKLVITL